MRRSIRAIALSLTVLSSADVQAAEDVLAFYENEAEVVSASRIPQPAHQAPATVYVVTQEDIRAIGAKTVWDAIRHVPGVEVSHTHSGQAEVGIRGFNLPLNHRVLVLIDGRSVLTSYFSNVSWESLPLLMEEIDRIEIVEGPASSVYGANAISGVIHIITKRPEQMQGGQISYTGGNLHKHLTSFVYGRKVKNSGFRFGAGYDTINDHENASILAADARMVDGLWDYSLADKGSFTLAGGVNRYNSRVPLSYFGIAMDEGTNGFVRSEMRWDKTKVTSYWNHLSQLYRENTLTQGDGFNGNSYDVTVEQGVTLPWRNELVFGGGFRRTEVSSPMFIDHDVSQDLWTGFMEDKWQIAEKWLLMASGRFDKHPFTAWHFSPRGSLLFTPAREHVFRASGGTAFRNPNLVENHFDRSQILPNTDPTLAGIGVTTIQNRLLGTTHMDGEKMESYEISHEGRFQKLHTTIVGSRSVFRKTIGASAPQLVAVVPPNAFGLSPFGNQGGKISSWAIQTGAEYFMLQWLRFFGSYGYQYVYESFSPAYTSPVTPRHQFHGGLQIQRSGFTNRWTLHWLDKTNWPGGPSLPTGYINAYFLLDAHVGYVFAQRWKGLEIGFTAFNLLDHAHHEMAPIPAGGAKVRGRYMGEIIYRF